MAGKRRGKTGDFVFEGVLIPRRTRSAKIAAKGIRNEEDLGNFLTAVFSDTLNGKIVLPKPGARAGESSKMANGMEHKLKRGLPVTIQPIDPNRKRKRRVKAKRPKAETGEQG